MQRFGYICTSTAISNCSLKSDIYRNIKICYNSLEIIVFLQDYSFDNCNMAVAFLLKYNCQRITAEITSFQGIQLINTCKEISRLRWIFIEKISLFFHQNFKIILPDFDQRQT